jgi:hypothetical protein
LALALMNADVVPASRPEAPVVALEIARSLREPLIYRGQRVLTNRQLAAEYGVQEDAVRKAFERHGDTFVCGDDPRVRPEDADFFKVPYAIWREWETGRDTLSQPDRGGHRGEITVWTLKGFLVSGVTFKGERAGVARQNIVRYYLDGLEGKHGPVNSDRRMEEIADRCVVQFWRTEALPQLENRLALRDDLLMERFLDGVAKRVPYTDDTKAQYDTVCIKRNGCCCFNCGKRIIDEHGNKIGRVEYDHHLLRTRNDPGSGWILCGECHDKMADQNYRLARNPIFNAFQMHRADLFDGAQLSFLDLKESN